MTGAIFDTFQSVAGNSPLAGPSGDPSDVRSDTCTFDWAMLTVANTLADVSSLKVAVVGDVATGKTELCKTMLGDKFDAIPYKVKWSVSLLLFYF